MPTFAELLYAIRGLWRLVNLDPGGLQYFDRSIEGFWRSFRVAFLVAPIEALLFATMIEHVRLGSSWSRIMAVEIIAYVVGWLVYPVVSYEICRWINRSAEYVGYIAVYNWSAILGYGLFLIAYSPLIAGWASPETSEYLAWLARALWLAYLWFLARRALGIDGFAPAGLILTDFLLGRALSIVAYQMML